MKKLLILLAMIGLLASCGNRYTSCRIITVKSILLENPTYSKYTYVGGGYVQCDFIDSTFKYNIGDTIK